MLVFGVNVIEEAVVWTVYSLLKFFWKGDARVSSRLDGVYSLLKHFLEGGCKSQRELLLGW